MRVEATSETLVRRLLAAVLAGAAGPLVGWLTAWLAIGPVLGRTAEQDADVVELTFDAVGVLLVVVLIAVPIGWVAMAGAFVLTRAQRPILGIAVVTVLLPPWWLLVDRLAPADGWAYLALLGCLPFAVRLASASRPPASGYRPVELDLSAPADPPG